MRANDALEHFSRVVDRIYEAGLRPELWPRAVESIAGLHGCDKALLNTPSLSPASGGFVFPHGLSESTLELWGTKFVEHDPWVRAALEKDLFHEGTVVLGDDLVPQAELTRTVFYREFLSRLDIWHFASGVVFDGASSNVAPVTCSIFNGKNATAFTERTRNTHSLVTRHLSRAVATMFRLRDNEFRLAANAAALDRLNSAVLLLGPRGNVVFANRAALEILEQEDGLRLRHGNPKQDALGWLSAERAECEAALKAEVRSAMVPARASVTHFSCGVQVRRPSGKRPFVVQFSAVSPDADLAAESRSHAIVFITDPNAVPRLDAILLARHFGLTKAEAKLAQELVSGEPLARIAERLAVRESTARTQLKSIFAKTGTARQAALVRLLIGLASTSPAR
ncbi:MAG TPA: helix-turn-helix transcriptional regulator [Usitatibacter sp.]|jgi:DNA-binding CsgD family transcriptional regulator|nr:helix-turn-helix transcriptional regulator [Usitatibacter sp.]